MLSTPFSPRIIKYEPPRGFIVPKFSTYDGSSDPFDHIMHYRQLMTLDIGNDMLLCKVFPTSLQGQALSWFHRLPANSIDNFWDLFEVFVGQYLCSTRHKQNISTLQNIKMQENETLREFVKRFGQAVLQVESYSMDAILQIFKRSICPGTPFFESLAKKPPTTMDDLFRRASKYSMLEDDDERRPPLIRMPLTTSYEKLLPMIRDLPSFRWPRPIRSNPLERDCNKRCAYHKDHGHTTETCRSLHYMVEDLLKAGHLKQYIRTAPNGGESSHGQGPRAPAAPIRAIINYIHGDPWMTTTVQEYISSIRPGLASGSIHPIDGTIVFPAMDPARVLHPHRDALILTLGVGDFDVKRILIDLGSSADLLQVAIPGESRKSPVRIQWFFHNLAWDVTLPVQAGPVVLNVLFSVVENLSLSMPFWTHVVARHEGYSIHIPSNG
uniref:Retrotransposon gag domain-containing protein n=1 Tax=Vitis vinifera TaxID=29760 RepID=A5BLU2_VITVI|nr:hypothetical protein VITISV_011858 [Vitis vinifera]